MKINDRIEYETSFSFLLNLQRIRKTSAYCNIQFSDPIRPTYDRYFYRALTASKTTQIHCIYILVTLQFDFISSSKRFWDTTKARAWLMMSTH